MTLLASGVTACPRQGPTVAQREQMSFCSVPQNQSSSDSCSTHSSLSTEKIPDSVSEVVVGEVQLLPPPPLPRQVPGDTVSASPARSFIPPVNTEKIGSISRMLAALKASSVAVEEQVVRSHVVKSFSVIMAAAGAPELRCNTGVTQVSGTRKWHERSELRENELPLNMVRYIQGRL